MPLETECGFARMGIYDRDYYRDGSGGGGSRLSVTTGLIILHVGLFFLLAIGAGKAEQSEIVRWGGFQSEAVLRGEVWRIVTSHLIPSRDLVTIIIGMMLLYWAGRPLEEKYGSKVFLAFYISAGAVAGLAKLFLGIAGLAVQPSEIGLAAPLFAVLVLHAFNEPRQIVMLFFVLPVQVGHLVMALVGLYLFSSILSLVNHGALLDAPSVLASAGFAAFFYYRGAAWLVGFHWASVGATRTQRPGRSLKIYGAESAEGDAPEAPAPKERPNRHVDEHLEAKLDEVLEKLARFGAEQLTGEEQAVLMKASEAYQRLKK